MTLNKYIQISSPLGPVPPVATILWANVATLSTVYTVSGDTATTYDEYNVVVTEKRYLDEKAYTFSTTVVNEMCDGSLERNCSNNRMLPYYENGLSAELEYGVQLLNENYFLINTASCCVGNRLDIQCHHNEFREEIRFVTLGKGCFDNIFDRTHIVTLGSGCSNNYIGSYSYNIIFGDNCAHNSISNDNSGHDLVFGNNCEYVDFQSSAKFHNGIIQNNTKYVRLNHSSSGWVKNFKVLSGTAGTSNTRLIVTFDPSKDYTQVAGLDSNGELQIFVPADLASQGEPLYIDCNYNVADSEPSFNTQQKAQLLQAFRDGNLGRVICVYKEEGIRNKYFKVVSWESDTVSLTINGANTGGTSTIKRWYVTINL